MIIHSNEVSCNMRVFTQDISNIKKFLNSLSKYDTNKKGIDWRAIHYGMMIEVYFITTLDCVEQIKNDYGELAFELEI
jgi:hypothetical protein